MQRLRFVCVSFRIWFASLDLFILWYSVLFTCLPYLRLISSILIFYSPKRVSFWWCEICGLIETMQPTIWPMIHLMSSLQTIYLFCKRRDANVPFVSCVLSTLKEKRKNLAQTATQSRKRGVLQKRMTAIQFLFWGNKKNYTESFFTLLYLILVLLFFIIC